MNKLIVVAAAGIVAFLAFAHPAAAPPLQTALSSPNPARAKPMALPSILVYVAGAIRKPGLFRLAAGARVNDAVQRAGGFAANADAAGVNLAEPLQDGQEVAVPRIGEMQTKRARAPSKKSRRRHARPRRGPLGLDLNAATVEQLASLPGVGYTLAQRIVEYRQLNGRFASVDELADVAGFTQRRVDVLSAYLRANAPP